MSEYCKRVYGVAADIGRRVIVDGEPGIIYKDGGAHIAVNFDKDKPGFCQQCHPTWRVEYLEMGELRKMTRSQARYRRYLEIGDCFDDFRHFLNWESQQRKDGFLP